MLLEMNVKLRRGHFDLTTELSVSDDSVGLFGKSGAGKSTVLGLIAGSIQPQSGQILLNGKIMFDSRKGILVPSEQRPVGAVLQIDPGCSQETVRDHLLAAYHRTLKQRRLFKLEFLLTMLELMSILDQTIASLSTGERQRVALARALFKSPKLLLLDDTFAAIGRGYRSQLMPILKRLQVEFGLPVLYASQSLGEILELTDRLIILDQGRVLRSGSLREVAKQRGILHYLGIRQIDNILPVSIRDHDYDAGCSLADSFGALLVMPLRPYLAINSQCQISIRAKDIALADRFIDGISIQNQIKGRICVLIPSGDSVIVQIDCGCILLAEITLGAYQVMQLREGQIVYCLIKTHAIVYLTELDILPQQQVVSHGDGYYYMSADVVPGHHADLNY